jgi:hypothetical protein
MTAEGWAHLADILARVPTNPAAAEHAYPHPSPQTRHGASTQLGSWTDAHLPRLACRPQPRLCSTSAAVPIAALRIHPLVAHSPRRRLYVQHPELPLELHTRSAVCTYKEWVSRTRALDLFLFQLAHGH